MVKIQTPAELSVLGTKIWVDGVEINYVREITFHQLAGEVPKLTIERYATDTVIEGEMEVEKISLCPSCNSRVVEQLKRCTKKIGVADVTSMNDEVRQYLPAPK